MSDKEKKDKIESPEWTVFSNNLPYHGVVNNNSKENYTFIFPHGTKLDQHRKATEQLLESLIQSIKNLEKEEKIENKKEIPKKSK